MLSESARATSAAETRFRIADPNSGPRVVKIVALDPSSEAVVKRLATAPWGNAGFFTASALAGESHQGGHFSMQGWLSDLAGRTTDMVDEIHGADHLVMIATAGENVPAAALLGEACSLERVMTTALVVGSPSATDEALSHTLSQLRPWALMLVIANAEDYIVDMLTALRA